MPRVGILDAMLTGLSVAARRPMRHQFLGSVLKAFVPIDFVRYREFEFAFRWVARVGRQAGRILDLASPLLFSLTLARRLTTAQISFVEILSEEAKTVMRCKGSLGLSNFRAYGGDARRLPFRSNTFDLVTSLSVVEHVAPEEGGDREVMREIGRVLSPGGIAIVTVPCALERFAEFREGSVYERKGLGGRSQFFQRFYDLGSIHRDLIDASGLIPCHLTIIEENFKSICPANRWSSWIDGARRKKAVFGPWYAFLSYVLLSGPRLPATCKSPYIACLVLKKVI
jgi:SAM-dependent methyltransferase